MSLLIASRRAERIAAALAAARARSAVRVFFGFITAYCANADCAAREVEIRVKEHDDPICPRLRCPACLRPLKLHHVQTLAEREDADEADARRSVNAQRYRLRHPDEAIPIGALLDDALPGEGDLARKVPARS